MIDSLEIIYKKNKSISFYQLIETISVILLVFSFATVYTRLFSTNYDLYLHTFLSLFLLLLSGCALYRLQKAQQSLIPIIRFIWLYYLAFLIPFHILNSFNYPINLTFLLQLGILPLTFPYFYPELFIRGLISAYRTILDQFSCCYGVVKPRCTVFAKGYQIMGLDKSLILNFGRT
ncbi:hypothetical protein, partial [Loigolactobacillus coryniformis]|uniref:hypothetical protein n=1 Tax=Loigolactobacillus coryniformis TaxID=1610 RepID=UPI00021959AA